MHWAVKGLLGCVCVCENRKLGRDKVCWKGQECLENSCVVLYRVIRDGCE